MTENSLNIICCDKDEITVDRCEAYRYMGLKRDYKNEEFEEIYKDCLCGFEENVSYKAAYRKSSLSFGEGNMLHFDFCSFESADLKKNLKDCKYVYVFAATTGMGIDRLLLKYSRLSPIELMTLDCIASSGIECFCDKVNSVIADGKETKPRFSLGYGDTKLSYQKALLSFLDAEKTLGITLNDSMMMTPKKSVTAFIGVRL